MKFSVPTKEFMDALDRVTIIAKKKSPIQILEYIKITANKADNLVTMEAQQIGEHLKVTISSATVIEDGFALINYHETKFIKIKDAIITVECENEKYFTVKSEKKKCELIAENDRYEKEMPERNYADIPAISVDKSELLETFKVLAPGLSDNKNKPTYLSYFIDPKNHAVVTCDGFIMIKRDVKWDFRKYDFNGLLIQGTETGFLNNLKKIVNHKAKETIEIRVSNNGKYAAFVGADFEYTFMLTEGEFFNYAKAIDDIKSFNVKFKFDIPAAYETFKEFADINSTSKLGEMGSILSMIGGNLVVGFGTSRFKTTEILDIDGEIPETFTKMINPKFMVNLLGVIKNCGNYEDHIVITSDNSLQPIYMAQGEYECMVVPMRMIDDKCGALLEYMKKSA